MFYIHIYIYIYFFQGLEQASNNSWHVRDLDLQMSRQDTWNGFPNARTGTIDAILLQIHDLIDSLE